VSLPKYAQVAASIRAQIADGVLIPGQPAPSGAALARATGYSVLTCRRALRTLVKDGVLASGHSRNSRPRVPGSASTPDEQTLAEAERVLSAALAARRRALGLTQPELAVAIGVSVTTVGHAETGRLWQSRHFWERADKALDADGELLRMHDSYRAGAVPTAKATDDRSPATDPVTCVTITWGDGTATTVYPPASVGTRHVVTAEIRETSRDGAPRP
jgi:DNA-binding transcriptional regulator YhcF (GntR family)